MHTITNGKFSVINNNAGLQKRRGRCTVQLGSVRPEYSGLPNALLSLLWAIVFLHKVKLASAATLLELKTIVLCLILNTHWS